MQKILITTTNTKIGGIERSLLNFLKVLDYSVYNVDLLIMDDGKFNSEIPKEVNIIYYKDYALMPYKFLYGLKKNILVKYLYDKQRFAFKKRYDISIAYNGFDNYADMVAASVKSKKKIIWVHNDLKEALKFKKPKFYFNFMWKIMGNKYKYFDEIVCVSKPVKTNFDEYFKKYKNKTRVIYNLLDKKEVIEKSREKTNIKLGKEYNIVAIGRLDKSKNFHKLIDIHKSLINKKINVKTYIIGDGKQFYNLSKKIRRLKLASSVVLLGEQANPYNVLVQADLLVSLSSYESFGYILLEAITLNVPFLSVKNSGSIDIYNNIMPLNAGVICDMDEVLVKIVKCMKKSTNKIMFNDKEYNKKIKNEINDLLKIKEN